MFLLSLAVRLFQLDLAQFDLDQVKLIVPAQEFVQTGRLPLVAGAAFSVGINIPPLVTYLLALPLLVSQNPLWIVGCHAAVDALGAAFVWAAVRQLSTSFAALAAGVFYAVLPAAAINARLVTNGGPTPFLCAVTLWALIGFLKSGGAIKLAVAVLAMGFAVQLHLTLLALAPLVVAAALVRSRDVGWRWPLAALVLVAAPLVPYAYFQARAGAPDIMAIASFAGRPAVISVEALAVSASAIGGDVQSRFSPASLDVVGWLTIAVVLVGAAVALLKRQPGAWLCVLWLAIPVLVAVRHSGTVAPHYFFGIFPAAAVLFGLGLGSLPVPPLSGILLGALVILRLSQWVMFQGQLSVGDVPRDYPVARPGTPDYNPLLRYSPPYGAPLRFSQQAVALTERIDQDGPVFVGPRQDYDRVFNFLSAGRVSFAGLSSQHSVLLPPDGSLLLLEGAGDTMALPLTRFASPEGQIGPDPGKPVFSLFHLNQGWLKGFDAAIALNLPPSNLGGDSPLEGFSLAPLTAGQESRLILQWRPPSDPRRLDSFAHLVDQGGRPWSSDPDVILFEGSGWPQGGALLSQTGVTPSRDAPTGGYWLDVGLYDVSTRSRAGPQVRLGPSRVQGREPPPAPSVPVAIFGAGEIALANVHVDGQQVELVWVALARPRADYTVFAHAVDGSGKILAQHDGPPAAGGFPTSLWQPGDVVLDVHTLSSTPAVADRLEIGLYTRLDLRRLAAAAPDGRKLGDTFEMPLQPPS